MRYTSDLIKEIIKNDGAKKILNQIAPIYANSAVGLWLFEVIGRQLTDMAHWCNEYALQIVPQTATWGLDYWESEYGIPFDPQMPIEKRRERIISTMRDRAPMNPFTLSRIASVAASDAEAEIEENTGKNQFTVWISGIPSQHDTKKICAAVDRAKPAHLWYDVRYVMHGVAAQTFGGILQPSYDITMKQVI